MHRVFAVAVFVSGSLACASEVEPPGGTASTSHGEGSSTSGTPASTSSTSVTGGTNDGTTGTTGTTDTTDTTGTTGIWPGDSGIVCGGFGSCCGNGVRDPGEQCDGTDLQGFECMDLGLSGGMLSCDPTMCTFDTSMCSLDDWGTD